MKKFDRKLIFPDGSEYYGYGFGSFDERIAEIVFNTSPVGYQEIISDPSYTYQTVDLLDQTVEGVACEEDKVFSVQYHPESAPGPQDSGYLFEQFIEMMEGTKDGEKN